LDHVSYDSSVGGDALARSRQVVRIVQATDPHLFRDDVGRLRAVPTHASFEDVMSMVFETMSDSDLCIVTGDLAQDEDVETYRRLRGTLSPFEGRVRVVPGNHDDPAAIREVFGDLIDADAPGVSFVAACGDVTVIGIDSHVPGEVGGEVGEAQLQWLEGVLPKGSPLVVCVHHPPVRVGTNWLDTMGLRDGTRLIDRLQRCDTPVIVVHGHTHQASRVMVGDIEIYGTPSTAFQFAPGGQRGETDVRPPGFRLIEWDGTEFRTEVRRLPSLRYPPRGE
jgi:Icc protein